jgi:hypothetical protein
VAAEYTVADKRDICNGVLLGTLVDAWNIYLSIYWLCSGAYFDFLRSQKLFLSKRPYLDIKKMLYQTKNIKIKKLSLKHG